MFVVFRCTDCGRFLYQEGGVETRECPCGTRVEVSGAVAVAEAESHREARALVRALQEEEMGKAHFRRYG
ncbi:MAG: hypothetical protein MAG715_00908 [Methanonatronarchaeales archaeon]|nr:hypothetical protein [Methanonatronarchaeales archaeon]